jgi:hypothetical protein
MTWVRLIATHDHLRVHSRRSVLVAWLCESRFVGEDDGLDAVAG